MAKTYSLIPDCCLGANISDPFMKMLWIELYAMANFGETELLHRGQLSTTYQEIASRTALTIKQVRNRIDKLVSKHQLLKKITNQGLILTIVNYDKNLDGKGRHRVCASPNVSNDCNSDVANKDRRRADERTDASRCFSEDSQIVSDAEGNHKGEQDEALSISIRNKREVVVREDDNNNSSSSECSALNPEYGEIRQKQLRFKNDVLALIDVIGWKKNLDNQVFKNTITRYLEHYAAWTGGGKLYYESLRGFTIDGSLHTWIRNEKSLQQ